MAARSMAHGQRLPQSLLFTFVQRSRPECNPRPKHPAGLQGCPCPPTPACMLLLAAQSSQGYRTVSHVGPNTSTSLWALFLYSAVLLDQPALCVDAFIRDHQLALRHAHCASSSAVAMPCQLDRLVTNHGGHGLVPGNVLPTGGGGNPFALLTLGIRNTCRRPGELMTARPPAGARSTCSRPLPRPPAH